MDAWMRLCSINTKLYVNHPTLCKTSFFVYSGVGAVAVAGIARKAIQAKRDPIC